MDIFTAQLYENIRSIMKQLDDIDTNIRIIKHSLSLPMIRDVPDFSVKTESSEQLKLIQEWYRSLTTDQRKKYDCSHGPRITL